MALANAPVSLADVRARKADRRTARGDALMEAVAFMDETVSAVGRLVGAEIARDVPSMTVINEAHRLAYRAAAAKSEVLALLGPEGDSAA